MLRQNSPPRRSRWTSVSAATAGLSAGGAGGASLGSGAIVAPIVAPDQADEQWQLRARAQGQGQPAPPMRRSGQSRRIGRLVGEPKNRDLVAWGELRGVDQAPARRQHQDGATAADREREVQPRFHRPAPAAVFDDLAPPEGGGAARASKRPADSPQMDRIGAALRRRG